MYGPQEPSLWLTRPLGYWENQLLKDFPMGPGPRRCTINSVIQLSTNNDYVIDINNFKESLRATIYNEPHLRCDVNLQTEPATWVPATCFSEIFHFVDLREEGASSLQSVWHLVEEEANKPWDYGSGKPLFRCTLVQICSGYVVMNCYHHAAGDGTTGSLIMGSILHQYNRLEQGLELSFAPVSPKPCVEELTKIENDGQKVQEMVKRKIDRAKQYKPFVPFSVEEMEVNDQLELPLNKTIFREGNVEKFEAMKDKCKKERVTIGAFAIAASYLAMAAVHAKATCEDVKAYQGIKGSYIDIPVNVRARLNPPLGNSYCGFLVTELTTKLDVELNTKVWNLSKEVSQSLKTMLVENEHILFCEVKSTFECGVTSDLASGLKAEDMVDLLVSNMMFYPFEREFVWGKIESVHTPGSFWTPGFSNYLLLFMTTDKVHYDMVHCPGSQNTSTARCLLNIIFNIMENASTISHDYSLRDILDQYDQKVLS